MMKRLCFILLLFGVTQPALAAADTWVTAERLNRSTCPDATCGVVGQLFFREKATVFEVQNDWGRVSKYYDASCKNGISEYVDSGKAACSEDNGIVQGRFAEWVSMKYLSKTRPTDPSAGATGNYALIKGSDDYQIYKDVFAKAASDLIETGQCTENDFSEMGGWVKSANRSGPVYFSYCGGMHVSNRLYLNATTGEVYK